MKKFFATAAVLAALVCPALAAELPACDNSETLSKASDAQYQNRSLARFGIEPGEISNVVDEGSTETVRRCSGIMTWSNSRRSIIDFKITRMHGEHVNYSSRVYEVSPVYGY